MSAKHTPGPWAVTPHTLGWVSKEGDTCWNIACVFAQKLKDGECHECVETANTRLIAAAPELLAALKNMLDPNAIDDGGEQARAAIAKAEKGTT